jgi:hypothetical protein
MSQGELHALALSVFLPRSREESPFRFVMIDDPVQSMDPAKVDGLARVLAEAAKTRQVVVFTHDERLADATRRLGLDARITQVRRRPGSLVETAETRAPAQQAIDEARVLLYDDHVSAMVRNRVVLVFWRSAIEASCAIAVRRKRLARGETRLAVEEALLAANTLYQQVALGALRRRRAHRRRADAAGELVRVIGRQRVPALQQRLASERRRPRPQGLRRRLLPPQHRTRCVLTAQDLLAKADGLISGDTRGASATWRRALRC